MITGACSGGSITRRVQGTGLISHCQSAVMRCVISQQPGKGYRGCEQLVHLNHWDYYTRKSDTNSTHQGKPSIFLDYHLTAISLLQKAQEFKYNQDAFAFCTLCVVVVTRMTRSGILFEVFVAALISPSQHFLLCDILIQVLQ